MHLWASSPCHLCTHTHTRLQLTPTLEQFSREIPSWGVPGHPYSSHLGSKAWTLVGRDWAALSHLPVPQIHQLTAGKDQPAW